MTERVRERTLSSLTMDEALDASSDARGLQ